LEQELKNPGYTLVPVQLFIDENSRAKIEIVLAKEKNYMTNVKH